MFKVSSYQNDALSYMHGKGNFPAEPHLCQQEQQTSQMKCTKSKAYVGMKCGQKWEQNWTKDDKRKKQRGHRNSLPLKMTNVLLFEGQHMHLFMCSLHPVNIARLSVGNLAFLVSNTSYSSFMRGLFILLSSFLQEALEYVQMFNWRAIENKR
jgi:hypothetical protein